MKLAITFEELLQKEKEYAINQNIEKIYIDYLKDEYQLKIKNYCKKYNLNIEEVNSRIRAKDRITASIFIKDPLKQNITENLISVYLKTSKLPIGGKDACVLMAKAILFVSKGIIYRNPRIFILTEFIIHKNTLMNPVGRKIINSPMSNSSCATAVKSIKLAQF